MFGLHVFLNWSLTLATNSKLQLLVINQLRVTGYLPLEKLVAIFCSERVAKYSNDKQLCKAGYTQQDFFSKRSESVVSKFSHFKQLVISSWLLVTNLSQPSIPVRFKVLIWTIPLQLLGNSILLLPAARRRLFDIEVVSSYVSLRTYYVQKKVRVKC